MGMGRRGTTCVIDEGDNRRVPGPKHEHKRQPSRQVAVIGLAVAIGQFQVIVGLAVQETAPHLQAQQVFAQRAVQVEAGLPRIALVTVLSQRES